jgi:hypothetical protein
MITEAFFLVAGFELEGYDEFIGSRCVVRAEQIVAQNHNCSRGKGFIRQISLIKYKIIISYAPRK